MAVLGVWSLGFASLECSWARSCYGISRASKPPRDLLSQTTLLEMRHGRIVYITLARIPDDR